MRILEALSILEDATMDSKLRPIDTPAVREALNLLEPYCSPPWLVPQFRKNLKATETPDALLVGAVREGQQQVLRVTFRRIYANVRWLLACRLGQLGMLYCRTKDPGIRDEIERLNAEFSRLPAEWRFVPRYGAPAKLVPVLLICPPL